MKFRFLAIAGLLLATISGCSHSSKPGPGAAAGGSQPTSNNQVPKTAPTTAASPAATPSLPTIEPDHAEKDKDALHKFCEAFGPSSHNVPLVIMYHDVLIGKESYTSDLDAHDFEQELIYLKENGFNTISIQELTDFQQGKSALPSHPVLLTFDDGYIGDYTYAYPLLKKYGMKATFFVHTGPVGKYTFVWHMSWDQLKEIDSNPLFKVYPHSVTHLHPFPTLSIKDLKYELGVSRKTMEDHLGGTRDVTAYPFGSYDQKVLDVTRQYYRMAFSIKKYMDISDEDCSLALPRFAIQRSETSVQIFKKGIDEWMENSNWTSSSEEYE
jgi:peptidoglycan/xylan/chitin deacetylase (PgdA/CDA1 family)